jgi:phosphatidylglycerophosphatase C
VKTLVGKAAIAFFDFDGTLTRGDSLLPFMRQVRGSFGCLVDLLKVSPWLLGYLSGIVSNNRAKQALLTQAFGGMHIERLREHGHQFARQGIERMLRTDTMALVRQHQAHGHGCVVVSASLDVYLEPWSQAAGFDYCIASSLQADANHIVTGFLHHGNCYGVEKVRRINSLLADTGRPSCLYAYGNSKGDIPMLAMVDEGMMVGKGKKCPLPKKVTARDPGVKS